MSGWCVVAYRFAGGMEVHGPYALQGEAATAAVVIEARDEYETAHTMPLIEPLNRRTT